MKSSNPGTFGPQSTRSFGLDKFEDIMQELAPANVSGIRQGHDEAAKKMAVFFIHTEGQQAASTKNSRRMVQILGSCLYSEENKV